MFRHIKLANLIFLLALNLILPVSRAAELNVEVESFKQRSTEGLVVELIGSAIKPAPVGKFEINQLDKEFIPLLTIAGVGSSLRFNNQDPLKHHVYSVSKGNKFELPLHNGHSDKIIQLTTPGIIKLGCNIHDWMLAYVYVAESDRIKIMDKLGRVEFSGLPAGDYQIKIWSPRLRNTNKPITRSVSIAADQSQTLKFEIKLRKHIRKPARKTQSGSYYGDGQK